MKTVLGISLLLSCAGCCPIIARPVTIGRVIDSYSGLGLEGAVVTVHEFQSQYGPLFRPPPPGEQIWESPEAKACALTDWQGKFSLPGEHFWLLAPHSGYWRIRVHRDDAYDAVYDYSYQQKQSDGWHPKKDIGIIELHIPPTNDGIKRLRR